MSDYLEGLVKSNYIPNIVILFAGQYFAIRQPDSGLVIDDENLEVVTRLTVNPTKIDPLRAGTTYSKSSFTLLDKNKVVSYLFQDQNGFRVGQEIEIFIGRVNEGLDFSEYIKLPKSKLQGFSKIDGGYTFKVGEQKDRLDNGAFSTQNKLAGFVFANSTVFELQDASLFPESGFGKIGDEFFSWTTKNGNSLINITRQEFSSEAKENYEEGEDIFLVENITKRNVIDFLLQILISKGGGGDYDVLNEGAGFSSDLVDIGEFLEIKENFFQNKNIDFRLYNIDSIQKFLESEIFLPFGLRLKSKNSGKVGLAILNRNVFEIDSPIIDQTNTAKGSIDFNIDENKTSNRVKIFWNWSDGRNDYLNENNFVSQESIDELGPTKFKELKFKGIKDLETIEEIANLYLERFSFPRPEISLKGFNNTSFLEVGDKTQVISDKIPTQNGDLSFNSTLEVLKKSYNTKTGIVSYTLAYTSFSGVRQCFIAPSSTIVQVNSQSQAVLPAGQGAHYRTGWVLQIYDNNNREIMSSETNVIESINDDIITFSNPWSTTLTANVSALRFADYNKVSEQQKKFCFIGIDNSVFDDNKQQYQITF